MLLTCSDYGSEVSVYFVHFTLQEHYHCLTNIFAYNCENRVGVTTAGAVSLGGGPGSGSEAGGAGGTLWGLTRSRSWLCCPADRNNRSTNVATENNLDAKPQVSSCLVCGLWCGGSRTVWLNVSVMGLVSSTS